MLIDTDPKPWDTNAIEAENGNITDSQCQSLDKGKQIAEIIKSKLYEKKKSNATWLVTTIKILIIKLVKKLEKPVFSFKRTYEAAQINSQILAAFNGTLGASIEAQTGSRLYYGSEFWNINGIKHFLSYYKYKERIVNII